MIDKNARTVDGSEQVELSESRRRVNALIGSLLEDDSLSDEARGVLRHLQDTPDDLVEMDADILGTVLLKGLS